MKDSQLANNSVEARRNLAVDRSNQDAEQSNEHLRSAAQAAILINGGAATAVLASIGKDKFDPQFVIATGRALMWYASGVGCAPCTIWFMNLALKHWNQSWQQVVLNPSSDAAGRIEHRKAKPWYWLANIFLALSIGFFIRGSWVLSQGFLHSPPLSGAVSSQSTPGSDVKLPTK
jgi:hypothetical protein